MELCRYISMYRYDTGCLLKIEKASMRSKDQEDEEDDKAKGKNDSRDK